MNIPTAKEFLKSKGLSISESYILKEVIEFAKLHVEATKKAIDKAIIQKLKDDGQGVLSDKEVVAAYPLTNIK